MKVLREMFDDFCEDCINKLPADQLSGFGIRCEECDPGGIEREGTYFDETAPVLMEVVDNKLVPVV